MKFLSLMISAVLFSPHLFAETDHQMLAMEIRISEIDEQILHRQQILSQQSARVLEAYNQFRDLKDRNNRTLAVQLGLKEEIYEVSFRGADESTYSAAKTARADLTILWNNRNELMARLKEMSGDSGLYERYEVRGLDLRILANQLIIDNQKAAYESARQAFTRRQAENNKTWAVRAGFKEPTYEVEFRMGDYYDFSAVEKAQKAIDALRLEKLGIASRLEGAGQCRAVFSI